MSKAERVCFIAKEQTCCEIATEGSLSLMSSIVVWNCELSDLRLPQRQSLERPSRQCASGVAQLVVIATLSRRHSETVPLRSLMPLAGAAKSPLLQVHLLLSTSRHSFSPFFASAQVEQSRCGPNIQSGGYVVPFQRAHPALIGISSPRSGGSVFSFRLPKRGISVATLSVLKNACLS